MTRRIRVLHVLQNLNYGGMERMVVDIIRRADRDRFDAQVMALQYLGHFAEGLDQIATVHLGAHYSKLSMMRPTGLAEQIRAIAPDVVHTHSGVWYKASLAARMAKVPRLVHTDHGRRSPDPWQDRLLDGIASRRTDVIVAVSEALGRQLARTVVTHPSRVQVVANGVDTTEHRPRADTGLLRASLGIAADVPIVGSVGRLEQIKGYDVMVDAFALLLAGWTEGPRPVLVLGGEGAERPALEQAAAPLGDAVRFLGWRDDIQDMHSAFTVFTMSSRSEGTSVSLLEAMSAGLCPVVTDVGGNRAVLGAGLAHRLVPTENPAALAAAWREVLLDPERRAADGRVARERVERAFGLDPMVRAYEALYVARL